MTGHEVSHVFVLELNNDLLQDNDRQAVIKVRGIIKGKLNAHGMRDEEPHYRNAENSSVYRFILKILHFFEN